MPDLEVVANIEELVSNLELEIAALIMAHIENALDYQLKASSIYTILISGQLVKPKMAKTKTIAVSEKVGVVSGWNSLNPKWTEFIAKNNGISLSQNETLVAEFYQNHIEEFNRYNYETKKWDLDSESEPGRHYRSHAEKQISVIKPCNSIGVSRGICEEDCYPYFCALA
ncbi:hypothetical protein NIES4071_86950 [Calothrix sp. NIES-4071]|nr:hypothetical protein NIES4071_86950 [Calothrix sp. NIES-4071]BAZ62962.1 hypothetical protein NIES4105_86880 [Calothrix sp. NIES-4105]